MIKDLQNILSKFSKKKNTGVVIKKDTRAFSKLRAELEKAKRDLSSVN